MENRPLNGQPYLELLDQIGDFDIWRVDGKWIRDNEDIGFTDAGEHYAFSDLIPEDEIWLDQEASGDESEVYIEEMLTENRLMARGMGYDEANEIATRRGNAIRDKLDGSKPGKDEDGTKAELELLDVVNDGEDDIRVCLVDGEMVRHNWYEEFTEGGHDLVYPFVPDQTIWIDNDAEPDEVEDFFAHEFSERIDMKGGMPYDEAHNRANKIELGIRHESSGGIHDQEFSDEDSGGE